MLNDGQLGLFDIKGDIYVKVVKECAEGLTKYIVTENKIGITIFVLIGYSLEIRASKFKLIKHSIEIKSANYKTVMEFKRSQYARLIKTADLMKRHD